MKNLKNKEFLVKRSFFISKNLNNISEKYSFEHIAKYEFFLYFVFYLWYDKNLIINKIIVKNKNFPYLYSENMKMFLSLTNSHDFYKKYFSEIISNKNITCFFGLGTLKNSDNLNLLNQNNYSEFSERNFYYYDYKKLMTLSGKKLQKRRNLLNNFKKNLECKSKFLVYDEKYRNKVLDFIENWIIYKFKKKWYEDPTGFTLYAGIKYAKYFDNIKIYLLLIKNNVVAIIIGEKIKDTINIYIHNCYHDFKGIYQYTLTKFLELYKNYHEIKYVNFYDDVESSTLRNAKKRYYPICEIKNMIYLKNQI